MAERKYRVNHAIRAPEVRLIANDGTQIGVMSAREAQVVANNAGLDLVEISPGVRPPVCKVVDFGKYLFEQEKHDKAVKRSNKTSKLKEIRMQPKIEEHDLRFKTKHIQEFLSAGNKVKVTVRFRGRELAYKDLGRQVLRRVLDMLGDTFNLDKEPSMEGRFMSLIISPQKKKG